MKQVSINEQTNTEFDSLLAESITTIDSAKLEPIARKHSARFFSSLRTGIAIVRLSTGTQSYEDFRV